MKTTKLKAIEDIVTGELGLILANLNIIDDEPMATNEGKVIAHDLIEHVNGVQHIGGIGDELEALGACWFIRGQFNDINRNRKWGSKYSPEESLAGDITNMGIKFIRTGCGFGKAVPKTNKGVHDPSFLIMIEISCKAIHREIDDVDADSMARLQEYLSAVIHFLRTGCRKANRKYKNPVYANNMFWTIANAIDNGVKHADMFEGAQFTLRYSDNEAHLEQEFDYAY